MPAGKKPFHFPGQRPVHRESMDPTPTPTPPTTPRSPPSQHSAQPAPQAAQGEQPSQPPIPRTPRANSQLPQAGPTPKPTPPMNVQWKCELHGLATDGKTSADLPDKITVGDKLLATCEGPPSQVAREGLKIELNDQQTYSLHLLEVLELGETKASLIVTPWRAGELKMTNPALTDAKTRVGMGDLELVVTTVIDPQSNPEGKPFPPWHPLTLAWPLWLWLFVAAIGVGILYVLGLGVRKSFRRKKLLAMLEKNASALSPVNHLNKELRRLQRKIPLQGQTWSKDEMRSFFSELESQFRWFLARELVIPAIDGSVREIMREMKKSDAEVYKHSARDVRVALIELRKAQSATLGGEDALQLMDLSRKVADRIAKERNV